MKQIVKEACERFKTHSYAHKDKIELFKARGYDRPESLEVICDEFEALIIESRWCVCIEERWRGSLDGREFRWPPLLYIL